MSAEQSIELIRRTIEESRRHITRASWKSLMLWGVCNAVLALVIGHLWQHTTYGPAVHFLWVLEIVIAWADHKLFGKEHDHVPTFFSKTIGQIWSTFGFMAGGLGFGLGLLAWLGRPFILAINAHHPLAYGTILPITSIIVLIFGMAGTITGRLLANRAITVCCFVAGVFGSILAAIFRGPTEMIVLAGVCVLTMVVPAFIIRAKEV